MEYKLLLIDFGMNNISKLRQRLDFKNKNITCYVNSSFFDMALILYENTIDTVIFSDYKGTRSTLIFLKMILNAFPTKNVIILGKTNNISNKYFFIQQGANDYFPETDIEKLQSTIISHYNLLSGNDKKSQLSPAAHIILRTIKENYFTKKNLINTISEKSGYSASWINKVIKKETRKTVGSWITNLRINAASNLLINTDLPIKCITSEVGYNSDQGLIKAFKSKYNLTPTQYRRNYYNKGQEE